MQDTDAFVPPSRPKHFLNNDAKKLAKHYKASDEDFSLELRQMELMLQRMNAAEIYLEIRTPGKYYYFFILFNYSIIKRKFICFKKKTN